MDTKEILHSKIMMIALGVTGIAGYMHKDGE